MIELNFFIFGRKWQIKVVEAHDPLKLLKLMIRCFG